MRARARAYTHTHVSRLQAGEGYYYPGGGAAVAYPEAAPDSDMEVTNARAHTHTCIHAQASAPYSTFSPPPAAAPLAHPSLPHALEAPYGLSQSIYRSREQVYSFSSSVSFITHESPYGRS